MLDVLEYLKKDPNFESLTHTLIFGEDVYFIEYFENLLRQKFSTKVYWVDEMGYGDFKNIVYSKNIFAPKSVIILKRTKELLSLLKGKQVDFIKNTKNILILEEYEELSEKDIKAFQSIFENLNIISSKQKKVDYLKNLIQKKFKKEGIELPQDTIEYIIDTIGVESLNLKNETDKLLILSKSILLTKDVLSKTLAREPKDEVFSMVDAMLKNDYKRALNILNDAMRLGQSPIMILGFLQKQFMNIYLAFNIEKDFESICKILNINHPFQKNIFRKQLGMIKKEKVFYILKLFQKADFDIKYYFKDPHEVLENIIIDIALQGSKNG